MEKNVEDCDPPVKKKCLSSITDEASASGSGSSKAQAATNGAGHSSYEVSERRPSESMWMPQSDKLSYLQTRFLEGVDPRQIIQSLSSSSPPLGARAVRYRNLHEMIPPHVSSEMLWRFLFEIFSEPTPRTKLPAVNTLEDVVKLIQNAKKILVVAGAGLSVSCGIPDFRSRDGLYSRVAAEFPQLRDPQSIFDSEFFREDPRPFFRFAKNIFVPMSGGELHYKPSPAHRFIKELENQNKLLRIYTQNIDGLEVACGISHERVIACHGSFETSTCTECGRKVESLEIADHINRGTVAYCASIDKCSNKSSECLGIMKPDIVFFGESLPSRFHVQMAQDKSQADLLIVIGTSLRVRPVSLIPHALSPAVPQILINRERLRHMTFDVELLGDCDIVVGHLRKRLAWIQEPVVDLPSFAFYPPNTYIFASSNGYVPPIPRFDNSSDESEEYDDSDSDSSDTDSDEEHVSSDVRDDEGASPPRAAPSPPLPPGASCMVENKRVFVTMVRPGPRSGSPSSSEPPKVKKEEPK